MDDQANIEFYETDTKPSLVNISGLLNEAISRLYECEPISDEANRVVDIAIFNLTAVEKMIDYYTENTK